MTSPDVRRALGKALHELGLIAVRRRSRDISLTAASTLSTLDRTGPRRLTELATSEGVAQPSMTSLVTSLERAGLLERRTDPNDGRVVLVALTDTGRDRLRSRREAGAESFSRMVGELSEEDIATLEAALPALNRLRELENTTPKKEAAAL